MSTPENERPEKEFGNAVFQAKMRHVYAQVSPQAVILCLFIVAIVFIPVGAAIIIASDSIFELPVRYDQYNSCTALRNQGAETFSSSSFNASFGCTTNVPFTLDKLLVPPIYIYYRIKGFNQNYRLYAKSMSDSQLSGSDVSTDSLSDCDPKRFPPTSFTVDGKTLEGKNVPYVPCGQVAWSMFNDTISLYSGPEAVISAIGRSSALPTGVTAECLGGEFSRITNQPTTLSTGRCVKDGIAFSQDIDHRFTNSKSSGENAWTGKGFAGSTDNEYFRLGQYQNEPGHQLPIVTDQDFMVWARIATLSDFRKPYRKITTQLAAGSYLWRVNERFDITSLGGEKHVILATVSWIGGKNHVLGALYLVIGSISLVLAFAFIGMNIARKQD